MEIRRIEIADVMPSASPSTLPADWLRLRRTLWSDCPIAQHEAEMQAMLQRPDRHAVFAAIDDAGAWQGFVEVSLREDPERLDDRRIGFLEGWYVEPDCRRQGLGRRLVEMAEQWARAQGCTTMASDAEVVTDGSQSAHRALGYREVSSTVLFKKELL